MNYLSVENISKRFDERILLDKISFGIDQGQKAALVGINGSGKSTLLKIIAGLEPPDNGKVTFRNGISMAFLSQNPEFDPNATILEAIFDSENEMLQTIKEYEYVIFESQHNPALQDRLSSLIEAMDAMQAWDYEAQIQQILSRLGLHDLHQKTSVLSGGQRKRVALARILIDKPDFLIMDEPTNHLDLTVIEWLENYLSSQQMTLLLVTHDRYFLESVTNEIFELEGGNIYRYKGNYSYYLEKKAEREAQQQIEVEKAKNTFKKELEWIRRQPKARGTKAKYRVEAFDEIKEKAHKNLKKDEIQLSVQSRRQGGKIIEIENVNKSFDGKHLIKDFSYVFKKRDRIGIIGPNGVGKSTFLNLLTGNLTPDTGTIDKGATTIFGYYTQEELTFKDDQRVIDIVKEIAEVVTLGDGSQITASQFLQHFQFPPKMQYNVVGKLSGGEKRRLQLLRVLIKNPNFLILDEPTNDLDINTLNILEDFLDMFAGCLILVSHDRYFMDRLVEHLFVFEGHGVIKDFPGNYSDYRISKEEEESEEKKRKVIQKPQKVVAPEKKSVQTKITYQEKQELEKLEKEIPKLEASKLDITHKMNEETGDYEVLRELGEKIAAINKEIEEKTERWLQLSELVD